MNDMISTSSPIEVATSHPLPFAHLSNFCGYLGSPVAIKATEGVVVEPWVGFESRGRDAKVAGRWG